MNGIKIIGFILLLAITSRVCGQNSATLKQKKEAITKEIETLRQARDKTDKNKKLSLQQISLLNAQINLREEKIKIINSEIKLLDSKICSNRGEIRSLQSEFGQLKQEYVKMIHSAYQKRNIHNQFMFVFAANNFNESYKRLRYIQQVSRSRKKKAKEIQTTQQNINKELTVLDKNKREKNHLLLDEVDEKQSLGTDKVHQAQMLEKLTQQEQTLKKQLAKKQKEAQELNRAIQIAIRKEIEAEQRRAAEAARLAEVKAKAAEAARLAKEKAREAARLALLTEAKKDKLKPRPSITEVKIKEKVDAKTSVAGVKPKEEATSVLSASPEAARLSHSFTENKGKLPNPVQGIITERFGTHVYKNITINNPGITIKTSDGAPVHAIFNGQVSNVIFLVNSYTIIVRHGAYFSIYSKLKNTMVAAGQKISTRQHIGHVSTNIVEGTTEMGFQIWKGSSPINPSGWIVR